MAKFIIFVVAAVVFWLYASSSFEDTFGEDDDSNGPEMTVCTTDAMQCPDGSYVGRSGPNCEFVCP